MKRCTDCGVSKTDNMFGKQKDAKRGTYYLRAVCKVCRVEQNAKRNQNYSPEQKLRKKESQLLRYYGITVAQYNAMFAAQNGACRGCLRHQSEFVKALSVDHCHTTKQVRGLLCSGCNLAIGNAKETPSALRRLAEYLESFDESLAQ